MWSVALLINTSTWKEMLENWKIICYVFLQMHVGNEDVNRQYYDTLLDKISKIRADPNISAVIQSTEPNSSESTTNHDAFDYDDPNDEHEFDEQFSTSMYQTTSSNRKNDRVSSLTNEYISKFSNFLKNF
jgi:hypothetical protein